MGQREKPENRITMHLLEPGRAIGGRDRGRDSCLLAFARMRELALVEPGPVVLIGDATSERTARAHGVAWDRRLSPTTGRLSASVWSLRQTTVGQRLVRCWSPGSLRVLAALALSDRRLRVRATLLDAPRLAADRLSVRSLGDRLEQVDAFDQRDADVWADAGVPGERIHVHDAGAPGTPPETAPKRRRTITTLNDYPGETDARRLSFLMAILEVGEYSAEAVCPASARHLDAARRYPRVIGQRFRLRLSDAPTVDRLASCDMCVWPDPTDRTPAHGARALWRAEAARWGVVIIEQPRFDRPWGPTPPEMVRPALPLFLRDEMEPLGEPRAEANAREAIGVAP